MGYAVLYLLTASPSLAAKEDTVLLNFQKVLPAEQLGKTYIVHAGDHLYSIIRNYLGIHDPRAMKDALDLIKKLNPQITDFSKIYPGQTIILPEKDKSSAKDQFGVEAVFYKVKKGDSLEKILMSQLNVKRMQMTQMLNEIREMNPKITNPDHIVVNQVLRLPGGNVAIPTEEVMPGEATDDDIIPEKPIVISETLKRNLLIAGQVFSRMNGTLTTDGQYYLPLNEFGQLTIDCTAMPMVEFDDGSIVFVELRSRLPKNVKEMVRTNWPSYRFIAVGEKDTSLSIIQKVINQSNDYRMKKGGKFVAGDKPAISFSPEWRIERLSPKTAASSEPSDSSDSQMGLQFWKNEGQCLPPSLTKNLAARGIRLIEIVQDFGITVAENNAGETLTVPNISGLSKADMIHNLLTLLGEESQKDAEINLFNQDKGGYNLTMRSDIILKTDNGKTLISFSKIPQEFSSMLKKDGYDILSLSEADAKIKLITKVLAYLKIGSTFNYFRLTVNQPNDPEMPFISAIFPALQIYEEDKFLHYLVDFPFDPVFYTYFKQIKEVSIVAY
jgi:LysM repeat protein